MTLRILGVTCMSPTTAPSRCPPNSAGCQQGHNGHCRGALWRLCRRGRVGRPDGGTDIREICCSCCYHVGYCDHERHSAPPAHITTRWSPSSGDRRGARQPANRTAITAADPPLPTNIRSRPDGQCAHHLRSPRTRVRLPVNPGGRLRRGCRTTAHRCRRHRLTPGFRDRRHRRRRHRRCRLMLRRRRYHRCRRDH